MEKKASGTTWTKQYCTYQKDKKEFTIMPYNQQTGEFGNKATLTLAFCVRHKSEAIEKRFCFDISAVGSPSIVYTFQALSESNGKAWMDTMSVNNSPSNGLSSPELGIWKVRTLYVCMAENVEELSFGPHEIITNVYPSCEPGWLVGTLNGKTGLIPENYVEQLL